MGRTVYLHCYVAKEVTPTVADEINGPTVGVDEEELRRDPEGIKQRLVEDFIGWLKGKPQALYEYVELDGSDGSYRLQHEPATPSRLGAEQQAMEWKQAKRHGAVASLHGVVLYITKGFRTTYRDAKTGRWVTKSRWEE
jgi:hypothetical protein